MVQVVRGLVVPSLKHHPSTNTNKARHLVRGMIPLSSAATWQALSGLSRGSCAACLRRSIFSLPDFSSLSPLLQAGESQPPPYHERKIFPCVVQPSCLVMTVGRFNMASFSGIHADSCTMWSRTSTRTRDSSRSALVRRY